MSGWYRYRASEVPTHPSGTLSSLDPDRKRKLLLHRGQIDELLGKTQQQSLTIIPVKLYFKDGKAKVEIALAKGRRLYDKRNLIMACDAEREAARATKEINRGGWA